MKITTCQSVREYLLAAGWDADRRQQAAEMLHHAQGCAECRSALEDFDRLRSTLAPRDPAAPDEPAGGWDAMHGRMADALASRGSAGSAAVRRPVVRPSLAIAAALLAVAAATFQVGRFFTPLPPAGETMAVPVFLVDPQRAEPAMSAISPAELARDVEIFHKAASKHDGQPGWMAVSPSSNEPLVGMVATSATPGEKLLLLRLALWHGRDLASNSDLLVLAGRTADLTLPLPSGQSLHYIVAPSIKPGTGDAANLYLWLELKTRAGAPLAALTTNLQIHPDEIVDAGKVATAEGDFELKIQAKDADSAPIAP